MKTHIFAGILLVVMTALVILNSVMIVNAAEDYQTKTEDLIVSEHPREDKAKIEALYDDFLKKEKWISLTVSHEDLTNIEGSFAEWIGAAEADDKETAEEMKSRLEDAFRHLGRLAKCNGDSIF